MRLVLVRLILAVRIASKRTEEADEDEAAEELGGRSFPSIGMDRYKFSFSSGLRRWYCWKKLSLGSQLEKRRGEALRSSRSMFTSSRFMLTGVCYVNDKRLP